MDYIHFLFWTIIVNINNAIMIMVKYMKEIIYNNDNLTKEEMNDEVIRIKAMIFNSNKELLIAKTDELYHLPGGHLEKNESFIECLKREVREEAGIVLDINDIEPFFAIRHYTKNYYDTGKNVISSIYYFAIFSDLEPNILETKLEDGEKKVNLHIVKLPWDDIRNILGSFNNSNPRSAIIAKEILLALDVFEEIYENK